MVTPICLGVMYVEIKHATDGWLNHKRAIRSHCFVYSHYHHETLTSTYYSEQLKEIRNTAVFQPVLTKPTNTISNFKNT